MQAYGDGGRIGLGRDEMHDVLGGLRARRGGQRSPDVSPLRAADLAGLPPALVCSPSATRSTDEATDYADRLRDGGRRRPTSTSTPGMVHGFLRWRGGGRRGARGARRAAARARSTARSPGMNGPPGGPFGRRVLLWVCYVISEGSWGTAR